MQIGFAPLLFIVFLALKLTGIISWSWWLIAAPLYVPLLLVIVIIFIAPLFMNKQNGLGYEVNLELLLDDWSRGLNKEK